MKIKEMTISQLLNIKPASTVICECGEDFVELSAECLSENGYGNRDLHNPQNAGPFLPVTATEMAELKELAV